MSTPHYEARREVYPPPHGLNIKPGFGPVQYYCDGVEITLEEYTAGIAAHRRDMPRFNAVEMQAIRKALQAAETVIAHTDDPARQQTKIEYLSWALAELSDAVQAWVLEGEPPRSPMSNPVPVPVELMDDYTPIAAELDEMMP